MLDGLLWGYCTNGRELTTTGGVTVSFKDAVDYRAYVRSQTSYSRPFFNRTPERIAFGLEVLFETAKKEIKIFSNDFDDDTYGHPHVIEAATKYLRENSQAKIEIISDRDVNSHPFVITLRRQNFLDRLELWQPTNESDAEFECIVADGLHYQFAIKQCNSRAAFLQFNDQTGAYKMQNLFANMKARSQPMPLHTQGIADFSSGSNPPLDRPFPL